MNLFDFFFPNIKALGLRGHSGFGLASYICMHFCLIGIQQLQLILLKVALIVAVEFHINVEFIKLLEPPQDQENEGVHAHSSSSVTRPNTRSTMHLLSFMQRAFIA